MKHLNSRAIMIACLALMSAASVAMAQSPATAPTATAPAPADWPQFRGPNRDGKSAETGLLAKWPEGGPKLLWSAADVGAGFSHVAVAGGVVYVTGLVEKDGVLRAFTLDGKPKWQVKYGPEWSGAHAGARSIPTIHDGLIYIASGMGTVYCIPADGGKPVWSLDVFAKYEAPQPMWGFAENLLVDGDLVFVTPAGKKATMVALDRKTGKEVWASKPVGAKSSYCSPMMLEAGGKRMIVTVLDTAVTAFSPEDGSVIWQHPYKNERSNHCCTPIYTDGILYVTSGYGKGAIGLKIAADGGSVKELWQQPKQDSVHGQAVVVDGYAYASSDKTIGGKWSCVNVKTGEVAWEAAGVGKSGSVIYADGLLYCYSDDGNVGIVKSSPKECQVVSTFKVTQGEGSHWAHLVVSNGRLFVRHGNALMCYDIAK